MSRHSKDTQKLRTNASTQQVADSKAQAKLNQSQDKQCEGSLTTSGDTRLTAGSNINLTGFGRLTANTASNKQPTALAEVQATPPKWHFARLIR